MIEVSIVIVSMNNVKVLFPCLDSIFEYTHSKMELFVVAYMFSRDNLVELKKRYPLVKIIESNEIRGFSENNNLALRQANGKFCFVVNDDTFIKTAVIDKLIDVIKTLPDNVAIISPNLKYPDGRPQMCGRRKYTWKTFIISLFFFYKFFKDNSVYENNKGVFQSYNITGAAFLIKTDVFKSVGWFNEKYFFCPEDIELSDTLNKLGYRCFVDSDNIIYHVASGTASAVMKAVTPACLKGSLIFFSKGNKFLYFLLGFLIFLTRALLIIVHGLNAIFGNKRSYFLLFAAINTCCTIFSNKTPKEIFNMYYKK